MEDLFLSFGRAVFPEEHRDIMFGDYVSYEVFVPNHESILPDMRGKTSYGLSRRESRTRPCSAPPCSGAPSWDWRSASSALPASADTKEAVSSNFSKAYHQLKAQFLVELFLCGCATLDKKRRPQRRGFVFEDVKYRHGQGAVKVLGTCRRESYQIAKAAPNPQRTQLVVWHWAYLASAFSFAPPPATASSSASSTSTPSISLISKSSLSS